MFNLIITKKLENESQKSRTEEEDYCLTVERKILDNNNQLKKMKCLVLKKNSPCGNNIISTRKIKNLQMEVVLDEKKGVEVNFMFLNKNTIKNILKVFVSWENIEHMLKNCYMEGEKGKSFSKI